MICYYCPSQQYVRLYIIRLLSAELYFYVDISKSNIIMSYPHLPSCNLRCRKATICRSLSRKPHFFQIYISIYIYKYLYIYNKLGFYVFLLFVYKLLYIYVEITIFCPSPRDYGGWLPLDMAHGHASTVALLTSLADVPLEEPEALGRLEWFGLKDVVYLIYIYIYIIIIIISISIIIISIIISSIYILYIYTMILYELISYEIISYSIV